MEAQRNAGKLFGQFPEALYATDVKFQPAHRPTGSFNDAKQYFCCKHKVYGFKVEASVAFPGVYVLMSLHSPGSVSDMTMFMNRLDIHRQCLAKRPSEERIVDNGEGSTSFPNQCAVLMDKGYEGCGEAVRSVRPKKKPRGGVLTRQKFERNQRVSSDRVLVENLFGRTCKLWKISYSTFKWSEGKYNMTERLTFAMTNFHASMHPLRMEDRSFYTSVLARYHSMAEDMLQMASRRRRRYRGRRQERLDADRLALNGMFGQSQSQGY
ncbi:hypothetical protein AeMF1_013004 [Aphanomyces euteiches]|nr:hypothetical protein AeMF1_013004 [Aphanomyces euteiches]